MLRTASIAIALILTPACVDDVEVPPKPPMLFPGPAQVSVPVQKLKGSRPANTAVLSGDVEVVPSSEETSFEFDVTLTPGENRFELWTRRPSGLKSRTSTVTTITYEPACPDAVVLSMRPPPSTNQLMHMLVGSKPAGAAVLLDDAVIVPANELTSFTHVLMLAPVATPQTFKLTTRDAKDKVSDPLRIVVVYETVAPTLRSRYPTAAGDMPAANTNIPTNAALFVELSEPVRVTGGTVPADLITVRDGATMVPGTTTYLPAASTFTWAPAAPSLSPMTTYTAELNVAMLTDLAGNAAAPGAMWTWSFTTGAGPSSAAPGPLTANAPASVATDEVTVDGTREPFSSIWVNGELYAPPGAAMYSVNVPVPTVGMNALNVVTKSAAGVSGPMQALTVTRTQAKPAAPTVDASVPKMVAEPSVTLTGTKPPGTAVLVKGVPVVCLNDETTWGAVVSLEPGVNDLTLTTRDASGTPSDPIVYRVNVAQAFSGKVPGGWQLKIFMNLRNQSSTRLANEFVTGPNNYGVDVWLEGPVAPGDTCEWDAAKKQRKNVKYVATIQHYIGVKTGHTVPFADDDYRGTDYVAALASGGIFSFLGVTADSPRRDGTGREDPAVLARVTELDLRQRIDCFGLLMIDGCTEATVQAGPHTVDAWEPRKWNPTSMTSEVLDQGEYLLWVMINLDRGGAWLTGNDYETCWGEPADFTRGMHRIVKRVALGGSPWSVTLTPGDELSGPDFDGMGQAKFLTDEGMTLSWGPP